MARKREYGMKKSKLILELYRIQAPICPLCKQSILQELQMYIMWKEKKLFKGKKVRRKDANINIDHIKAVAEGGSDDIDNLALTHKHCNAMRGKVNMYKTRPKRVIE